MGWRLTSTLLLYSLKCCGPRRRSHKIHTRLTIPPRKATHMSHSIGAYRPNYVYKRRKKFISLQKLGGSVSNTVQPSSSAVCLSSAGPGGVGSGCSQCHGRIFWGTHFLLFPFWGGSLGKHERSQQLLSWWLPIGHPNHGSQTWPFWHTLLPSLFRYGGTCWSNRGPGCLTAIPASSSFTPGYCAGITAVLRHFRQGLSTSFTAKA